MYQTKKTTVMARYITDIVGRKRQKHLEGLTHVCMLLYLTIPQFLRYTYDDRLISLKLMLFARNRYVLISVTSKVSVPSAGFV